MTHQHDTVSVALDHLGISERSREHARDTARQRFAAPVRVF